MLVLSRKPYVDGGAVEKSLVRIGDAWVLVARRGTGVALKVIAPEEIAVVRGDAEGETVPPKIVQAFTDAR